MDKPKIVIVLEGGLVQHVFSDVDAEVMICDYDIEGTDDEDTMEAPAGDKGVHCVHDAHLEPGLVSAWFRRFELWIDRHDGGDK